VFPGRGLSCVLFISPARFRVEQNSSFLKVPRRAFFPSPLTFCCMNASTVRQPPVALRYLPVCTGDPDSLLVCFHWLCWRKLSFPGMLSASRGGAIFSFQKFVSVSQQAEHNTQLDTSLVLRLTVQRADKYNNQIESIKLRTKQTHCVHHSSQCVNSFLCS